MSVGGGGGARPGSSNAPMSGAAPFHGTCTMAPPDQEHADPEKVIELVLTAVACRIPQPWI